MLHGAPSGQDEERTPRGTGWRIHQQSMPSMRLAYAESIYHGIVHNSADHAWGERCRNLRPPSSMHQWESYMGLDD